MGRAGLRKEAPADNGEVSHQAEPPLLNTSLSSQCNAEWSQLSSDILSLRPPWQRRSWHCAVRSRWVSLLTEANRSYHGWPPLPHHFTPSLSLGPGIPLGMLSKQLTPTQLKSHFAWTQLCVGIGSLLSKEGGDSSVYHNGDWDGRTAHKDKKTHRAVDNLYPQKLQSFWEVQHPVYP